MADGLGLTLFIFSTSSPAVAGAFPFKGEAFFMVLIYIAYKNTQNPKISQNPVVIFCIKC